MEAPKSFLEHSMFAEYADVGLSAGMLIVGLVLLLNCVISVRKALFNDTLLSYEDTKVEQSAST